MEYRIVDKKTERTLMQGTLEPGKKDPIHEVDFGPESFSVLRVSIPHYEWSNYVPIEMTPTYETYNLKLLDDKKRPLNLYLHFKYVFTILI